MANVQFGNVSADMRLVNDVYGIPALRNFVSYISNFEVVREEVVSETATQLVVRGFNAANESVVASAFGNVAANQFNTFTVEATGIRATVKGDIFVDPPVASGVANAASVVHMADGSLVIALSEMTIPIAIPIDTSRFPSNAVVFAGNDSITSGSGNDYLLGYAGNDVISAQGGNDFLQGGAGKDVLDGGPGADTAVFSSALNKYTVLAAPDGRIAVAFDPRGGDGIDVLSGIEQASFGGAMASLKATNTPLEYVASHLDLMNALGTNAQAGFEHYVNSGYAEGRSVSFEGLQYIASYGDLIGAFGGNADAGAAHYIASGRFEGRQATFDGLEYIAS